MTNKKKVKVYGNLSLGNHWSWYSDQIAVNHPVVQILQVDIQKIDVLHFNFLSKVSGSFTLSNFAASDPYL